MSKYLICKKQSEKNVNSKTNEESRQRMNTLYLVCSRSCMNQMEIPYLLNNSPDLHGESKAGEHYAEYMLNGESIDHEPGPLGKVRVHDDYWNLTSSEKEQYYNFDIRNELEITEEQLDGLLNLIEDKSIALVLHAQNLDFVFEWSRAKPVILINAVIGDWDRNIETWAAREYNYLMEDDENANFSGYDHVWPGSPEVANEFISRMHMDRELEDEDTDRLIKQEQWMKRPEIYTLWDTVGITPPDKEWIDAYIEDYDAHQEFNLELEAELRLEYDGHEYRYT